jgi:hypothetical protein
VIVDDEKSIEISITWTGFKPATLALSFEDNGIGNKKNK